MMMMIYPLTIMMMINKNKAIVDKKKGKLTREFYYDKPYHCF